MPFPFMPGTEFRGRNKTRSGCTLAHNDHNRYTRHMDEYIQHIAENHRKAGMIGIAWHVEQVVQSLGLMSYFVDASGDGPFIQEIKR